MPSLVQRRDLFLTANGPEDPAGDAARQHLRADEDDDAEEPERDQGEAEPLRRIVPSTGS